MKLQFLFEFIPQLFLKSFVLLILSHVNLCFSETPLLLLSLKTQVIPSGYLPRAPDKLRFHHNVSLSVSLSVGSPPQNVSMVIDTGSELSWLRCNRTSPAGFDPTRSSSYLPISCSSPTCTTQTRDFPIPASCDSNNLCHATLSYADFSSTEGNLASDTFRFGSSDDPGVVFGCMNSSFDSSNADGESNTTGLLGMNRGSLSFVSQLKFPKFSYCISDSDSSGVLLFGYTNFSWLAPLNYTPLVQMSTPLPYFDRAAYTVRLRGIKVSGKLLQISDSVFIPDHTGAGQTMVDSGTQFTFLLGPAYTALRSEFLNQTNHILRVVNDPNFAFQIAMDLCYRVPMNQTQLPGLPSVSLVFDGAEMTISDEQVLYRIPGQVMGGDSVYCFTFGNSDLLGVEQFIIGHHQQQNLWMEFDLEKSRIGLTHVSCSTVGERLGLGK
ncbi:hypothetical protein QN277_025354 [Acacia crassicarpa]|uniref:Peptidase A1 domain-containing protein n=1 Tax=Acacia crassicarpa TaxID=499986 RepID=A0AAE1JHF6_9FABA|nr:hypothetical protein QN277_025354 [Acacia crassicarpa]